MSEGWSLINLKGLSKPVTAFIKKISDAMGVLYEPKRIIRKAQAEAEAKKIAAQGDMEVTEIQRRGLIRLIVEEGKKQENIEKITRLALPAIKDNAKPEEMGNDWIAHFFDKCRIVSDTEMQSLWAKILAGEANSPGSYSKRTVNLMSTIEKSDAHLFTKLCGFGWHLGEIVPIIFDFNDEIYNRTGIDFPSLIHLKNIGLIDFEPLGKFKRELVFPAGEMPSPLVGHVFYYGTPVRIELPQETDGIKTGSVVLTKIGCELAPICGSERSDDFFLYALEKWLEDGYFLSSPWPRRG